MDRPRGKIQKDNKMQTGGNVMEKIYKAMRNVGAANIAVGIVMIVAGIGAGVVSIILGADLLRKKSELSF